MKIWLVVAFTAMFMIGAVSLAFAAAGVEYGTIISKPTPGSGLGAKLSKKMSQATVNSKAPTRQVQKVRKSNQGRKTKGAGALIMDQNGDQWERID